MANGDNAQTVIAEDVEVTGTIKCDSNIQINGKLNGDLNCTGNAVVGNTAQIKGNINVEAVTVFGQINGNVVAKDRIELKSSARMLGDIKSKRLTVEDGVTFVGKSDVNPSGQPAGRPAAAPAPEVASEQPEKETGDKSKGGVFGKKS